MSHQRQDDSGVSACRDPWSQVLAVTGGSTLTMLALTEEYTQTIAAAVAWGAAWVIGALPRRELTSP